MIQIVQWLGKGMILRCSVQFATKAMRRANVVQATRWEGVLLLVKLMSRCMFWERQ